MPKYPATIIIKPEHMKEYQKHWMILKWIVGHTPSIREWKKYKPELRDKISDYNLLRESLPPTK